MPTDKKSLQKIKQLDEVLKGASRLLIVMQNYPDPDALASASALRLYVKQRLGLDATLTSSGMVGRAENRALMHYLRQPMRFLEEINIADYDRVAMVDTQPRTGNNAFPPDVEVHAVIDHHPIRKATRSVKFTDVRSHYGSCSTILYEYLREGKVDIDAPIATGLLYGIKSDTQDLGREASQADIQAFLQLYQISNPRLLSQIQYSKTPRTYFRMLSNALRNALVYGDAIIANVGKIDTPDIIGEMADLLLRDEESNCTLCYGFYEKRVLLSLRIENPDLDAGKVMRGIVSKMGTGGGHKTLAGGQIPLEDRSRAKREEIEAKILESYLKETKQSKEKPVRLVALQPKSENAKK
ncbi:MAG: DHH family phosphoesterase [Candidatus Sumerlaeia bacterium]